jgi:plasmid segregation protein ParM
MDIFESGVIERERASELAGMIVEFEGKVYEIYDCYSPR